MLEMESWLKLFLPTPTWVAFFDILSDGDHVMHSLIDCIIDVPLDKYPYHVSIIDVH